MTKIGVLMIQLGTPDEPTASAVQRYLHEFLSDPRVIETPRWKWQILLKYVILPRRAPQSAAKYARIWDPMTGSPLLHITRLQAKALQRALPENLVVRIGMRYGKPSIDSAVCELLAAGTDRIVVLPMYPQYSAASTGTACDKLFDVLRRLRFMPSIRIVPPFFADAAYIRAQASIVRAEHARLDRPPDKIVFSFHGYPVAFVERGDPYQEQVEATTQQLANMLRLSPNEWLLTYQSQFGRQAWIEPFTEATLCKLAREGARRVMIASPGFTTDCLETIDEIGRESAESFRRAGGEQLIRCPCLNDSPEWIEAMRQLILRESLGWYPAGGQTSDGSKQASHPNEDESTVLDVERTNERAV